MLGISKKSQKKIFSYNFKTCSITNYFVCLFNLFRIKAKNCRIDPVYTCERCGQIILNVFDLEGQM